MGLSRSLLRAEAKKLYKEQVKGIPKRQRLPFSQFFKNYLKVKSGKVPENELPDVPEDFDFEDMVNVNMISDDDLESADDEEVEENS